MPSNPVSAPTVEIDGSTANEISESIRNLVTAGALRPGDPVPPIRDLASRLGVHRNTVANAYRLLTSAGVAETRGRRGTVVRALPVPSSGEGGTPRAGSVDLSSGNPDPGLLPDLSAALTRTSYTPPLYGAPAVEPHLLQRARTMFDGDVDRSFEITITNGSVDAVERLLTTHLTRGDAVVIENPCFLASIDTLKVNGFRAVPVPVDDEGMRPDLLLAAIRDSGARAVILTPRAHNPTGSSLSANRAQELRELLSEFPHVMIIEDDHFSAVASTEYHHIPPLTTARWATVRSVSKFLGPDLRVAIVASDPATAAQLGSRLRPGANWVSHLQQRLTADLLGDSEIMAQLAVARQTYAERRAMLITALSTVKLLSDVPADGLNIWVPLHRHSATVTANLADRGWLVRDGGQFTAPPARPHNAVRVTTSQMTPDRARRFAATLLDAVK